MPEHAVAIARTSRLSGAALLSVAQVILLSLGYITHILIGKLGGPALYGIYGVALSFLTILNMILTLGVPVAVSKELAEDEKNSGGILRAGAEGQFLIAATLSICTLLLAKPLSLLLGDASLAPVIAFTAAIYPLTAFYALFTNYFNGLHAFGMQAALIIFYAVLKLTGSVALLFYFRVYGALAGFAIGGAAAAVLGLILCLPSAKKNYIRRLSPFSLFTFAGTFVGTPLALQILMSLDLFMVEGVLHNSTQAGLYNAASTISNIPYFVFQALGFVLLPSVARLMKGNQQQARDFLHEIFRYLYLLLLPSTVMLAVTSRPLLQLFFSRQFKPATVPLVVLMIAMSLLAVFYLLTTIVAGTGKTRVSLIVSWLLLPISLVVGLTLIPHLQLIGAAIATGTASTIGAVVLAVYAYRELKITFSLATLIRGLVASIVMLAPLPFFLSISPYFLPLAYTVFVAIYVTALYLMKEIRPADINYLKKLRPTFTKNDNEIIAR